VSEVSGAVQGDALGGLKCTRTVRPDMLSALLRLTKPISTVNGGGLMADPGHEGVWVPDYSAALWRAMAPGTSQQLREMHHGCTACWRTPAAAPPRNHPRALGRCSR